MANGFVLSRPGAYGGQDGNFSSSDQYAQKFVAPGSGIIQIAEVGFYGACYSNGHIAFWTHDAANDCPESIVENGDTGEVFWEGASHNALNHCVYGTKPQLTGGVTYWIAAMMHTHNPQYVATGGSSLYVTSQTYGTWVSASGWHTHTDGAWDFSLYAIYEQAGLSLLKIINE